ncbi:G2/mitotic-specific cyclin [Gryganskiella cystojenkinii]|nr:G2/mitotic-specific cyclin [Gryganskiella cystojenkinii]
MAQPLTRVRSNRAQELENVAPVANNIQQKPVFVRRSTDVLKATTTAVASNTVVTSRPRPALGDATNRNNAPVLNNNNTAPVKGRDGLNVRGKAPPLTRPRAPPLGPGATAATMTSVNRQQVSGHQQQHRQINDARALAAPVLGKRLHAQVSESSAAPMPVKAHSRVVRAPPPVPESVPVVIKSERSEKSEKLTEKLERPTTSSGPTATTSQATTSTTTTKKEVAPPPVPRKAPLKDIPLNTLEKSQRGPAPKLDFEKLKKSAPAQEKIPKPTPTKQEVIKMLKSLTPDSAVPVTLTDEREALEYEQLQDKNRPVRDEFGAWGDDKEDSDPLMVSEYVNDIFKYMQELECKTMPDSNYMDAQKELAWKMRYVLVDWIAEVHHKFRLLPETLFLAVNLMDRFLSSRSVATAKFQLVGVTALFIASKYEEVMAPSIHNFVYMADDSFKDFEILSAERFMLQALEFQISYPSPLNFLRRISKGDGYDIHSRTVAKYLMEVPLMDHAFLECPPSMLAGAAMCLARRMIGRSEWDAELEFYSGYTMDELMPWMERIVVAVRRSRSESFIYQKYSSRLFMRAAVFVREWIAHLDK